MNVIEIMEIFKLYLIGKKVFYLSIVDTWAETLCSSGFGGWKDVFGRWKDGNLGGKSVIL